ncbi:MAG TPA: Dabb family protein [Candidatus Hydrogenedentes bacterium]|nr:Dabb family protein [Candidatus Hydrogenedentota bacterium]
MFVHAVYFWLREGLTLEETARFRGGMESLRGCESVRDMFVGVPASTNRPVVERGYTFALVVLFDDLAGHDAYQVHPIHNAFVDTFKSYWTRVQIYDSN